MLLVRSITQKVLRKLLFGQRAATNSKGGQYKLETAQLFPEDYPY